MASKRRFRRTLHGRTLKLQSGAEEPHDSLDELFKKNGISALDRLLLKYTGDKSINYDDYPSMIEDAFDAKFENPPKDKPVELMVPKVRSQPISSLLPPFDQSLQCDSAVQQHRESIPDSTKNDSLDELFKKNGISALDRLLLKYTGDKSINYDDYPSMIEDAFDAKFENPPKDKPVELMVPKVRSQPITSLLPPFDQSLQCDSAVQQHREYIPNSSHDMSAESKLSSGRPSTRRVLDILFEKEDTVESKKSRKEKSILQRGSPDKKAANITQKSSQSVLTAGPHISTVQSLSRLLEKNDTSKASSNQNFVEPKQSLGKRSTPEAFDASDEEENIVPSKKSKQA